jgi:hypothetical protein
MGTQQKSIFTINFAMFILTLIYIDQAPAFIAPDNFQVQGVFTPHF